jgi:hypothetical protein
MRLTIEVVVFFVSVWSAYRLGKMETARFVWNLLSNQRNEGMAEAVCLYCAMMNPNILHRNGWKCVNDVYLALRSKKELTDNI